MDVHRNNQIADLIASATKTPPAPISSIRSCSGGCIHQAQIVELEDGRQFFVKSNSGAAPMFEQEIAGLAALAESQTVRVPHVIASGVLNDSQACLVLEAIQQGHPPQNFFEHFGRDFAQLHRRATASQFGWHDDNYLGSSIQRNQPSEDWVEFFAEHRLRSQLRLARNNSLGSHELFQRTERIAERLDRFLGFPEEQPCLLHGDLWSGNFLANESGQAVIFDPAVYYGRREADLAMPLLFGGFPQSFFDAYHESNPLADDWQDRVELYKLYHLLNHLNLFGTGYLESCLEIVRRFA